MEKIIVLIALAVIILALPVVFYLARKQKKRRILKYNKLIEKYGFSTADNLWQIIHLYDRHVVPKNYIPYSRFKLQDCNSNIRIKNSLESGSEQDLHFKPGEKGLIGIDYYFELNPKSYPILKKVHAYKS